MGATNTGPKECLKALVKRLNHPDPHVVVQVGQFVLLKFDHFQAYLSSGLAPGFSGHHIA